MRYFKKDDSIYAYDVDQEHLITDECVELLGNELDRHINPQNYLTDEQRWEIKKNSLGVLTRRRFKLALLENDLLEKIESEIAAIQDDYLRQYIQIEYQEGTEFHRTSESIQVMCDLLGLTEDQINQMWEHALTL
ncbi:hypothetical protein [Acinetobacter larvae]|uniref:Uncharacterized protein n=1 Tax=Acinetobacter larvae TaxID=1789224 RepID=A0A1B2LZG2_9GAMM|nr:hypothetical protein [Acinetobacter larvae]AOA58342.1 hypothetical protein BFG52_08225 [Acinetobacter larvae]